MRKCFQHDAKRRCKINDKSMNFRNLRFLAFCEEYNPRRQLVGPEIKGSALPADPKIETQMNKCKAYKNENHHKFISLEGFTQNGEHHRN